MTLCECGCGGEVNRGNKFIRGHNQKGKHHSKKTKQKISDTQKGMHHSEKTEYKKGYSSQIKGDKHPRYNGGKKSSRLRTHARRRGFGYDEINKPLRFDDEVGHHITINHIIYVPEYINMSVNHNIETGLNMDEVNFYTLNYLFLVYGRKQI